MKLQFDANQDYQLEAIRATVALFTGQPDASQTAFTRDDELASLKLTETGVANHRVITDEQWLANLTALTQSSPFAALTGAPADIGAKWAMRSLCSAA